MPELLRLANYGGDWDSYLDAVYETFLNDIVRQQPEFRGLRVSCRRHPETRGRSYGFWHLIQEGRIEDDRVPDLRRCERIGWVRYVIENADTLPEVDVWMNIHRREANALLWYCEEYLVVLAERRGYWLLKTAYCTDREHRRRSLRAERDAWVQGSQ